MIVVVGLRRKISERKVPGEFMRIFRIVNEIEIPEDQKNGVTILIPQRLELKIFSFLKQRRMEWLEHVKREDAVIIREKGTGDNGWRQVGRPRKWTSEGVFECIMNK